MAGTSDVVTRNNRGTRLSRCRQTTVNSGADDKNVDVVELNRKIMVRKRAGKNAYGPGRIVGTVTAGDILLFVPPLRQL